MGLLLAASLTTTCTFLFRANPRLSEIGGACSTRWISQSADWPLKRLQLKFPGARHGGLDFFPDRLPMGLRGHLIRETSGENPFHSEKACGHRSPPPD